MERTLDFSGVQSYDLSFNGEDLVLSLIQGSLTTKIRILASESSNASSLPPEQPASRLPARKSRVRLSLDRKIKALPSGEQTEEGQTRKATATLTRLNEDQVREIRSNWDATVVAHGGKKGAAAKQLAKIYNCTYKNIYAIIYRYSWGHVE